MLKALLRLVPLLLALTAPAAALAADGTMFDLGGPALTIKVTRGETTLPITQVPSLRGGDRLTLKANLPDDQSAHYLLIVGFLRGATNPPPKNWFFEAETWKPKKSTLTVTIPQGAEQAIVFLAPETGGGRDAVVSGVRGRPGVFVRATQDLHQASIDRLRLDTFIAGIAKIDEMAPERLGAVSPVLASSLGIKLDAECLKRPRSQQAACLTQKREQMVLQINRGATLTETLTGAPADIASRIADTREAGAGYYSPYIGLARDLARLFGAFRTAQYQYLPALAVGRDEETKLQLNEAPSFQNPRSVLVMPMPPISAVSPPTPRPANKDALCLARPNLVLPAEDAALFYATAYPRDVSLRVGTVDGKTVDLPLRADPEKGGFVLTGSSGVALASPIREATLHGRWGFETFEGPAFALQTGAPASWRPTDDAVVIGREQPLTLKGDGAACVEKVELRDAAGATRGLAWKTVSPGELSVTLPLQNAAPGPLTLLVSLHGADKPAELSLKALAEASRLDGFLLYAGDETGTLSGARLDQVTQLQIGEARFTPGALTRAKDGDRLAMTSPASRTLTPGDMQARVTLRDGRTTTVRATVAPARPGITLVNRNIETPARTGAATLKLPDSVLPTDGRLTFSVRKTSGAIGADDAIEIAAVDGSAASKLTMASGGLQRIGKDVAVATFEPRALLGAGTVGALRFRPLQGDAAGDWQPLAQVVRLPALQELRCPASGDPCTLAGSGLFLIAAIADNAQFANALNVPDGFVGSSIALPRPQGKTLYLRLHDAPDAAIEATLP